MSTKFFVIRFIAAIAITSSFFVSCDDEISEVGSGSLIGSELNTEERVFEVQTSQLNFTQPQTNNLIYNLFGRNDSINHNILTQVNSVSVALQDSFVQIIDNDENDLEDNDENDSEERNFKIFSTTDTYYTLDSISLVIPLRYSLVDSDDDDFDNDNDTRQYNIESNMIGNSISFDVFESKFLLQQNNPESSNLQMYYGDGSDGTVPFGSFITDPDRLLDLPDSITTFNFSDFESPFTVNLSLQEEDILDGDTEKEIGEAHSAEGLSNQFEAIRIPLESFRSRILELITNGDDLNKDGNPDIDLTLINEETFTESFRGLHLRVTGGDGIIEVLNANESLINAGIQLNFTRTQKVNFLNDDDGDDSTTEENNIITTLQFSNNPISIFEMSEDNSSNENESQTTETESTLVENTDEILLQGGIGSIGVIELSLNDIDDTDGDGDFEEFTVLRENKALLNDAILEFTVVNSSSLTTDEIADLPDNILITAFEAGTVLTDFLINNDGDENNETLKENHLIPIRELDEDGETTNEIIKNENGDIVYRINITRHLSNIINSDSDDDANDANILLAINVTDDITIATPSEIFGNINIPSVTEDENETFEQSINQGSLLSFKTVSLYGSSAEDENKRPRLIVKFTETDSN